MENDDFDPTFNQFGVGQSADWSVIILNAPIRPWNLSKADALCLAAQLVALALPGSGFDFGELLDAVQNGTDYK